MPQQPLHMCFSWLRRCCLFLELMTAGWMCTRQTSSADMFALHTILSITNCASGDQAGAPWKRQQMFPGARPKPCWGFRHPINILCSLIEDDGIFMLQSNSPQWLMAWVETNLVRTAQVEEPKWLIPKAVLLTSNGF